jgi:radical SAM superfamily enzyme YgiQ (UPF0313 family)/glycosyltransferase involved in cell wall biosynthesis
MKILLTNPPYKYPINNKYEKYFIRSGSRWPHSGIKKKGSLPHYLPFPFFLAYTAALLLKDRHGVYVLDAVALDYDDEQFIKESVNINPEIILFETTTPTIEHDLYIAKKLKECTSAKIILTGSHATIFNQDLINKYPFIDYILKGEYEVNCSKLIKRFSNNESIEDVEGVVYKDSNCTTINSNISQESDCLDLLPMPARHLFPSNKINDITRYWDGFCQFWPAVQIQATRGCPYGCYFCLWNEVMYSRKKYRKFSSHRVIEEIEYILKAYKPKEIYFDDDSFTIDKNYVREICHLILKEKMNFKWSCMSNIINLDKDLLRIMKEAGCIGIKFGIESFSLHVLKQIEKPILLKKVKEIVIYCSENKIKTHATFMLGLLNENINSLKETEHKIKTLAVDTIQVSLATPFPGTRFYEISESRGFIKHKDWQYYDGSRNSILQYPDLEEKELLYYRDRLFRVWLTNRFLDPRWILRQIFYLKRYIFGLGFKQFVIQLQNTIIDKFCFSHSKSKKIIIICHDSVSPLIGGGAIRALKIAEGFSQKGKEILIVAPSEEEKIGDSSVYRLRPINFKNNFLFELLKFNLSLFFKLIKCIRNAEFVFVHNATGLPAVMLLARIFRKKVFLEITDIHSEYRKANLTNSLSKLINILISAIECKLISFSYKIIAVSNQMKLYLQSRGIDKSKIYVVYDGVGIDEFSINKNKEYRKKIVHLGFMNIHNGVEYLIKSFAHVVEKSGEVILYIIGDGNQKIKCENLIKKLGMENYVVFKNFINHSLISDVLKDFSIGVIPRIINEGNNLVVSLKLLEYWASGTAVVSTRLRGIEEIAEDKRNILFAKPGDSKDLSEKILHLLEDENRIKSLALAGRNSAKLFSWESVVEKTIDICSGKN